MIEHVDAQVVVTAAPRQQNRAIGSVLFGIERDRLDSKFGRSSEDADGDFRGVGNEQFFYATLHGAARKYLLCRRRPVNRRGLAASSDPRPGAAEVIETDCAMHSTIDLQDESDRP
nr:hypothetical protein [Bradyrhizobium oropedii]